MRSNDTKNIKPLIKKPFLGKDQISPNICHYREKILAQPPYITTYAGRVKKKRKRKKEQL